MPITQADIIKFTQPRVQNPKMLNLQNKQILTF